MTPRPKQPDSASDGDSKREIQKPRLTFGALRSVPNLAACSNLEEVLPDVIPLPDLERKATEIYVDVRIERALPAWAARIAKLFAKRLLKP